jgi:hypothetical protein
MPAKTSSSAVEMRGAVSASELNRFAVIVFAAAS